MTVTKLEAFVIHLERAHQRRPQVERIVAACPVPVHVLDAVDGAAMTEEQRADVYVKDLNRPRYPFEIGPGEIGCFLSHRKAWQAILDRDLTAGLVIEDDVEIDVAVFEEALELALGEMTAQSYMQFQVRRVPQGGTVIVSADGCEIRRPVVVPLRTSAQLVGREAAERLLALTRHFDRPVDGVLQMPWVTGVPIDCVVPSGVIDRTSARGGSTIKTGKTLPDRILREFKRFIYRQTIARRSRQEARRR